MRRSPAQRRKAQAELQLAIRPEDRYLDACLVLRRLTVDFPAQVDEGQHVTAGGVDFVTAAAGREGVPVVSCRAQESASVPHGAGVEGGGVLRAEEVLRAGGRWDRLEHCYTADPVAQPLVYDLVEAQVEAARWFAAWLLRFKARQRKKGRTRDKRSLMHYGARGGGKTELALQLLVALCLEVPQSITWIISVSRPQSEEDVRERLQAFLPKAWYSYRGQPKYRFLFFTGSRLRELSADAPQDLKQGRVDMAVVNEAAKMDKRAYAYPLGRISDRGGLLWLATNPPTIDVPKGVWVQRLHQRWKETEAEGEWFPLHVIRSDSRQNAAIDQEARSDVALLMHAVSPEIAKADAEGLMSALGDRAVYAYDRVKHGRLPPPELDDITEEITRLRYGRPFPWLCGVDFQDQPYIIGSFWKAYGTVDRPVLYCWSDFTCKGSEDDWLDELLEQGIQVGPEGVRESYVEISQSTILFIADSSAQWQDRKHRGQNLVDPPSFNFFKQRGLHVQPPTRKVSAQSKYARNPLHGPSYGQLNRWIAHGRCTLSPYAKRVDEAFIECLLQESGGKITPTRKWTHPIDTARYVAWYVEPPTQRWARGGGTTAAAVP